MRKYVPQIQVQAFLNKPPSDPLADVVFVILFGDATQPVRALGLQRVEKHIDFAFFLPRQRHMLLDSAPPAW